MDNNAEIRFVISIIAPALVVPLGVIAIFLGWCAFSVCYSRPDFAPDAIVVPTSATLAPVRSSSTVLAPKPVVTVATATAEPATTASIVSALRPQAPPPVEQAPGGLASETGSGRRVDHHRRTGAGGCNGRARCDAGRVGRQVSASAAKPTGRGGAGNSCRSTRREGSKACSCATNICKAGRNSTDTERVTGRFISCSPCHARRVSRVRTGKVHRRTGPAAHAQAAHCRR